LNNGVGVLEVETLELIAKDDVALEAAAARVDTDAVLPVGAHPIRPHLQQHPVRRVDAHALVAHNLVVREYAVGAPGGLDTTAQPRHHCIVRRSHLCPVREQDVGIRVTFEVIVSHPSVGPPVEFDAAGRVPQLAVRHVGQAVVFQHHVPHLCSKASKQPVSGHQSHTPHASQRRMHLRLHQTTSPRL
jgi:hypothetical protein